jgi:uncharacterized protein YceH (UPF0502 family)
MSAGPVEIRVLGCLLEKQRTTPDQYPLSLNALRLACNQSTNRDPVVSYDERTVHVAAQELHRRGWARLASGAGSRAVKYRQLFTEALGLGEDEVAVLAVLMLRGGQTPGELKQRCERLHSFATLSEVEDVITRLRGRELVASLGRRPGQKEERFTHLLGEEVETVAAPASVSPGAEGSTPAADAGRELGRVSPASDVGAPADALAPASVADLDIQARVERLETEVAELREALLALEADLGGR